jgi:hypothetical protein
VLLSGVLAFLLAYLGFALAGGLPLLALAFLLDGAGIGLVETERTLRWRPWRLPQCGAQPLACSLLPRASASCSRAQ